MANTMCLVEKINNWICDFNSTRKLEDNFIFMDIRLSFYAN